MGGQGDRAAEAGAQVGWTAVAVAAARAAEAERGAPWFVDPYAAHFVAAWSRAHGPRPEEAAGGRGAEERWRTWVTSYVQIRTRFYDEFLVRSGARQVVLLAAGLDTRAFRMAWPDGTHLFEVDVPSVLAFKEAVLAERDALPRCARAVLGLDLRDDWPSALRGAGHVPDRPTAWLAEGLHPYLTPDAYRALVREVGRLSGPGSVLGLDLHSRSRREAMRRALASAGGDDAVGPLWHAHGENEPAAVLAEHGWPPEAHSPAERSRAYGRPLPPPIEAAVEAAGFPRLVTASVA
ncbi:MULTISPECIES: SAM-dependent methyltransferase [Actinomadura]|uniref:S-adenosyl-L-methionine-dependent methyltransferase n=1 Tax=Actinomadura yumaensis TaxID=111807 RepID=A0ABW2CDW0_9ACTN|nr:SAM-dependent methyltransferase [Actinomadura sp. J1-007]MWK38109.1 SAM-dependent methyltransferase [Actinomadura sp. J1-007]